MTRTYGGWRRQKGLGMMGMTGRDTAIVGASVGILVMFMLFGGWGLTFKLLPLAMIVWLLVTPVNGRPIYWFIVREYNWFFGGDHAYRSGWLTGKLYDGLPELPGPAACCRLIMLGEGHGTPYPYGVVHDQNAGVFTISYVATSTNVFLGDEHQVDEQVNGWGDVLTLLCGQRAIQHMTVVIETSPHQGDALSSRVRDSIVDDAPPFARQVVLDLAQRERTGNQTTSVWIDITVDPRYTSVRNRGISSQLQEAGRLVWPIQSALTRAGLSGVRTATASELAARLRGAFDPEAAGYVKLALDQERDPELDWASSCIGWKEERRLLVTDSAVSTSYVLAELPRSQVHASILREVLAPGSHYRRWAMIYTPVSPDAAAKDAEREKGKLNALSALRAQQGRTTSARDAVDIARAEELSLAEATGSGLLNLQVFATTTVPRLALLPDAESELLGDSAAARISFRPALAAQGSTFLAGLGLGVHPGLASKKVKRR